MLDLPQHPVLDKSTLVGSCLRLPVPVDAGRLRAEVAALPPGLWGTTSGRVGVHRAADAVFLRGHAPAAGDLPVEDRPPLELLPCARALIEQAFGAQPLRCLLARLPAGATIAPHVDRAPYFWKTLRIHVPVETHDRAWMVCDGLCFVMRPGEAWALNNCTMHAVWNAHATLARTHLICDFVPSPALLDLLARGERGLGRPVPEVDAHLAALASTPAASAG
jgi:Aspartyl/Asparaginyl beta-hydroxylase